MFILGFLCGAPFWIAAGLVLRHCLDLYEIPQREPHDVVDEHYGADDVIHTTYPQRPHIYTQYPRNGGETAQD